MWIHGHLKRSSSPNRDIQAFRWSEWVPFGWKDLCSRDAFHLRPSSNDECHHTVRFGSNICRPNKCTPLWHNWPNSCTRPFHRYSPTVHRRHVSNRHIDTCSGMRMKMCTCTTNSSPRRIHRCNPCVHRIVGQWANSCHCRDIGSSGHSTYRIDCVLVTQNHRTGNTLSRVTYGNRHFHRRYPHGHSPRYHRTATLSVCTFCSLDIRTLGKARRTLEAREQGTDTVKNREESPILITYCNSIHRFHLGNQADHRTDG